MAASSTTQYLYDGPMLVAEYNTSGAMLRRYGETGMESIRWIDSRSNGQGVDEALVWFEGADLSSPHWLHTDNQGSVIAATDGSAVATPYAYSVTGEPKGGWSSSAPAFRYTGQVAIASAQIYFYKARMYDPALGRFLQTDPAGYSAGMNLYAYVGNDPANGLDPTGLCEDGVTECVTVSADRPPFSWEWNAWDKISSFIESIPRILPSIPPPNDAGNPSRGSGGNSQPQNGPGPGATACLAYVAQKDGVNLGLDAAGAGLLLFAPEAYLPVLAVSGASILASGVTFNRSDLTTSFAAVGNSIVGYHASAFGISQAKTIASGSRYLGGLSVGFAGLVDISTALDDYKACRVGNPR